MEKSTYRIKLSQNQVQIADRSDTSLSHSIGRIIERYGLIVESCMPKLFDNERGLLVDIVGRSPCDNTLLITWGTLATKAENAIGSGLFEKWRIEVTPFMQKLSHFSLSEVIAVIDYAERYWAEQSRVIGE